MPDLDPVDAAYAVRYFDRVVSLTLGDIPADGLNFLRQQYVHDALSNPNAIAEIRTWADEQEKVPVFDESRKWITVYCEVGRENRKCEFDREHVVYLYEQCKIADTGRTWLMDNGYEKRQEAVYEDVFGHEYRKYVTIDYFNNISYIRDDTERSRWSTHTMKPFEVVNP